MSPNEYCAQKIDRHGSTCHYSLLFLDPSRRRAMTGLAAFCCELRDIVESAVDENAARIKLAWWRTEIAALYRGDPQHLVTRALAPCLEPFRILQRCLDDIIDGAEMDLLQTRSLDFIALERYCRLVAAAASECAANISGRSAESTLDYARQLGVALRLTRIVRNVGEDARRGRIYLPVNELQQFGVPVADILNARYSDNFTSLMQFQYDRASRYFDSALTRLPAQDRSAQLTGLIAAAIYRTLLEEIRADGFKVLHQRTSLTPIRKLWLAWKTRICVSAKQRG